MTREPNGTNLDKTAGFNAKPVTVELNGQQIDAAHHFTTPDNRLLHLYINCREGGIDVTVPLCSDKPPYARSDVGRRALGMDSNDNDDELVVMTDGGLAPPVHGVSDVVEFGDIEDDEPVTQSRDTVAGHVVAVEDDRVLIDAAEDMTWFVKQFTHGYDTDAGAWVWHREGPVQRTPAGTDRGPRVPGVFRCEYCGAVVLTNENHAACGENGGEA